MPIVTAHSSQPIDFPLDRSPVSDSLRAEERGTSSDGSQARSYTLVTTRIDSPIEIDYYKNGGVLHTVLRQMIAQ